MRGKRLDVWRRSLPSEGVFDLLTCLPCCFPSSFPARLEQTAASTLGDRSTNGSLEETFCFMTGAKQYQLVWGQWLHSSWSALSDNPTGNNSWPSPEPGMPGSAKKKKKTIKPLLSGLKFQNTPWNSRSLGNISKNLNFVANQMTEMQVNCRCWVSLHYIRVTVTGVIVDYVWPRCVPSDHFDEDNQRITAQLFLI